MYLFGRVKSSLGWCPLTLCGLPLETDSGRIYADVWLVTALLAEWTWLVEMADFDTACFTFWLTVIL